MKCTSAASIATLLALFASTQARALSGTDLYQSCQDKKRGIGDISCIAYVRGFLDGAVFGLVIGKNHPTLYCPPKGGIAADQGRLIVEKYLRDHPEKLHLEAAGLVINALMEAFPCPPKSN